VEGGGTACSRKGTGAINTEPVKKIKRRSGTRDLQNVGPDAQGFPMPKNPGTA